MSLERIKNINKKIVHFIIAIFLHLIVAQHIRYMVMELGNIRNKIVNDLSES